MDVLIPYALSDDAQARDALHELALPQLQALLRRLSPQTLFDFEPQHAIAAHEAVLAQTQGLNPAAPPWAALRADALGLPHARQHGWACLTLVHWELGQNRVSLRAPDELDLGPEEARALYEAMQPYFAEDGFELYMDTAQRWLLEAKTLEAWAAAAPERVVGRDLTPWLPPVAQLRRLQSEMQMLLYTHPVNDARSAKGQLPVNGFWLHGVGPWQAATNATPHQPGVQIWDALQASALRADWKAWAQAWRTLDAQLLALHQALDRQEPVQLVLCSELQARSYRATPRPWWKTWPWPRALPRPVDILVTT